MLNAFFLKKCSIFWSGLTSSNVIGTFKKIGLQPAQITFILLLLKLFMFISLKFLWNQSCSRSNFSTSLTFLFFLFCSVNLIHTLSYSSSLITFSCKHFIWNLSKKVIVCWAFHDAVYVCYIFAWQNHKQFSAKSHPTGNSTWFWYNNQTISCNR